MKNLIEIAEELFPELVEGDVYRCPGTGEKLDLEGMQDAYDSDGRVDSRDYRSGRLRAREFNQLMRAWSDAGISVRA